MNPTFIAAIGIGLLLLIIAVVAIGRRGDPDQDKLTGNEVATASGASAANRCGSQRTYEEIKRELFRQAADTRGRDQAAFDRIAAHASVRVEKPLLRQRDADLGTLRCSGRLTIDLPPGVAVVGGRRALGADIDYVLQPAADGSGDVVMLEGADSIIVPLATLAQSGEARPLPPPTTEGSLPRTPSSPVQPLPPAAAPVEPPQSNEAPADRPRPTASARPSFNCRYARTRGEIAVCSDASLASLDRQMAAQYYRAISNAESRQRAQLVRSRSAFLRFRDRCATDACIAETYRGRMREISDIMAGEWRPRR